MARKRKREEDSPFHTKWISYLNKCMNLLPSLTEVIFEYYYAEGRDKDYIPSYIPHQKVLWNRESFRNLLLHWDSVFYMPHCVLVRDPKTQNAFLLFVETEHRFSPMHPQYVTMEIGGCGSPWRIPVHFVFSRMPCEGGGTQHRCKPRFVKQELDQFCDLVFSSVKDAECFLVSRDILEVREIVWLCVNIL
jgi:hypothetical protein